MWPATRICSRYRPDRAAHLPNASVSSPHYNGRILAREDLTGSLAFFQVSFDDDPRPFLPGQYLTVGLDSGERLVQRPYSVASSARRPQDGYELYIRLIPGGELTPLLFTARPGQRLALRGPKGRFTLDPHDPRIHLFIATGCGIAPFMAMLRTLLDDDALRPTVLLHGVSHVRELAYRALLEQWADAPARRLHYVPTISRPDDPANAGWRGSVGRVEAVVAAACDAHGLTRVNSVAYVCGNPEMVRTVGATLRSRGFGPEQVRTELYWPLPH